MLNTLTSKVVVVVVFGKIGFCFCHSFTLAMVAVLQSR